jgi:UDP-N-acetylenolpyruvoylglucosamine reductase
MKSNSVQRRRNRKLRRGYRKSVTKPKKIVLVSVKFALLNPSHCVPLDLRRQKFSPAGFFRFFDSDFILRRNSPNIWIRD